MEIKNWTYEEYPSFDEEIEGVTRIPTTGDEKRNLYLFECGICQHGWCAASLTDHYTTDKKHHRQ